MPDLRKDPIVGRWVIIAKNRAQRPIELLDEVLAPPQGGLCPFCEGHEQHTPHEIAAYRSSGTLRDAPGWHVRVVPNKYPALEMAEELNQRNQGMYLTMRGVGVHEVIIESPRHLVSTTELSQEPLRDVLLMYRDRLLNWKQDPRLIYGMIFKNVGAAAGASLEHVHSQLIVTPIVPINVAEELAGSQAYFDGHGRCVFCEMIQQERAYQKRIVLDSPGFVVFCPFAARFPYETWILPTSHASHYETLSPADAEELAQVLRRVLIKIETALDWPAYNYIIHTAPFDTQALGHYHWHIEIIPRVTKTAGFEWGSGFYINPVPPEEAAMFMRDLVHQS
ncbi:MAG TPA: galactose-1-phosphate uridylyltransferase [Pirellulales bacterium]|nr:galactose-1-phosphate uridylyltransferase [Pirellulales bacterium]